MSRSTEELGGGITRKIGDAHEKWLFLSDNPVRRLLRPPKKFALQYVSKGAVAADLGCGPGFFILAMAEVVGPSGKVYAIDSDERSIEALRSKVSKQGYRNIEVRVASASELGFIAGRSVDFVLGDGLLCCMADRYGGINEIKRILKPKASAYISVAKNPWTKDPRDVGKVEWKSILDTFRVIRQGENLTMRWAVVSSRESESLAFNV